MKTEYGRFPVAALNYVMADLKTRVLVRFFGCNKRRQVDGPWQATSKDYRGKTYALKLKRVPEGGYYPSYTGGRK